MLTPAVSLWQSLSRLCEIVIARSDCSKGLDPAVQEKAVEGPIAELDVILVTLVEGVPRYFEVVRYHGRLCLWLRGAISTGEPLCGYQQVAVVSQSTC